jgi:hypothetical protein
MKLKRKRKIAHRKFKKKEEKTMKVALTLLSPKRKRTVSTISSKESRDWRWTFRRR